MNYDDVVKNNLENCFDKDGLYFDKGRNYIDPDCYTYQEKWITPKIIIPQKNEQFLIGFRSDALFSRTKFSKINRSDMGNESDKELYKLFRENMGNCLVWPSRTWSINQARRSLGNDDRLDLLLQDINTFYNICDRYNAEGLSAEFINEIIAEIPKTCYAFLNMPTLIWLCSFSNFKDFIEKCNLKFFVDEEEHGYVTNKWDNYYKNLYERTIRYKEDRNRKEYSN